MLGRFGDARSDLKHRSATKFRKPSKEVRSPSSRWIEHPMPATCHGCGGPRRRSAHGAGCARWSRRVEASGGELSKGSLGASRSTPASGEGGAWQPSAAGQRRAADRPPCVARLIRATLLLTFVILGSRQLYPSPSSHTGDAVAQSWPIARKRHNFTISYC